MSPEPPAPPKPAPVTRQFIPLEPAALEAYVGIFPLPKIGQSMQNAMEDGKLWTLPANRPRMELKALGPAHFYVEQLSAEIEFTPKSDGGMAIKITQPGGITLGDRVATLTAIAVRNKSLVAVNSHHGEIGLEQFTQDRFLWNMFYFREVHFVRGAGGKPAALTVGGGRVTAVRFVRK